MGDINIKLRAEGLGKDLETISSELQKELNSAVESIAHGAFAKINAEAQARLSSTRQDYIRGLNFDKIDENTYLISMEGDWATALEDGFNGFDMNSRMLKSQKTVQVGSRAGEKWVQTAMDGHKYAAVPFEHQPFSKASKAKDLNSAIRKLKAKNAEGKDQPLTRIFKDKSGNPIEGKVARVDTDIEGIENLTKFQTIHTNENTGKQTVQSIYMTWKMISEVGPTWQHPGFEGLKAFEEAEKWVEQEIDIILKKLL